MGGKRPDQYAIDPGEANATDYKNRRHDEFVPEDKERVEKSMHPQRQGESLIPEGNMNPALAELRARKERDDEEARGEHHREGGLHGGGHAAAERHRTSHREEGMQAAPGDEMTPGSETQGDRQPLNASRDDSRRTPDAERTE